MKRMISSLLVLALVVSLLAAIFPLPVSAADYSSHARRWNIMLVVDSSGSMDRMANKAEDADHNGLRFEAIGSLLSVLQDDGHNVGAVAFGSAHKTKQDSKTGAILAEYPLMSLEEDPNAKENLRRCLENAGRDLYNTDINSALLYALEKLKAKSDENHLPSAVFLFTDGKNTPNALHAGNSQENRELAIEMIRDWKASGDTQFEICGVYLNTKNEFGTGVQEIIREALNVESTDSRLLGNSYREIKDATSCVATTDAFLKLLGYSVLDEDETGGKQFSYGKPLEDAFIIPGCGVEEFNIRLHVADSSQLPFTEMKLTAPDGSKIEAKDGSKVKVDTMDTYQNWKIKDPMPGEWKVEAIVRENSGASISYTPFFSSNVDVKLAADPAQGGMHMNQDVTFEGWLETNGQKRTAAADYTGYRCLLSITQPGTGYSKELELPVQNGQTVYLNEDFFGLGAGSYGAYKAVVRYECPILSVASEPVELDLTNQTPVVRSPFNTQKINYGLFQKKEARFPLDKYFEDAEDDASGTPLKMEIDRTLECDPAGIAIEGGELVVTPKLCGSGKILLRATDSQGAVSENMTFSVIVKDVTLRIILIIVAVVVILIIAAVIAAVIIGNIIATHKPKGECRLSFEIEEKTVMLPMTPPGVHGKRSDNLYDMASHADSYNVQEACHEAGVSAEDLRAAINEDARELRKIAVSVKLDKGTAKIKVKAPKNRDVLYNSSIHLSTGVRDYTFSYELPAPDDDGETDGWNGPAYENTPAGFGGWGDEPVQSAPKAAPKRGKKPQGGTGWDDTGFSGGGFNDNGFNDSGSSSGFGGFEDSDF